MHRNDDRYWGKVSVPNDGAFTARWCLNATVPRLDPYLKHGHGLHTSSWDLSIRKKEQVGDPCTVQKKNIKCLQNLYLYLKAFFSFWRFFLSSFALYNVPPHVFTLDLDPQTFHFVWQLYIQGIFSLHFLADHTIPALLQRKNHAEQARLQPGHLNLLWVFSHSIQGKSKKCLWLRLTASKDSW